MVDAGAWPAHSVCGLPSFQLFGMGFPQQVPVSKHLVQGYMSTPEETLALCIPETWFLDLQKWQPTRKI